MTSRSSYRNGWRSGGVEEEDPDGREEGQELDESSRAGLTLRSTIVCVRPDPETPPHRPSRSASPSNKLANELRSDRIENLNFDRRIVSHYGSLGKVLKGSDWEQPPPSRERMAIRINQSSRERDSDVPIAVVRDFDRDKAAQRDYSHRDRQRDREEGFRRESGRLENERLPTGDHSRDQDSGRFGGDVKGKEKRSAGDNVRVFGSYRERSFQRDGGSFNQHDRSHTSEILRKNRDDSFSPKENGADSPKFNNRVEGVRTIRQDDIQGSWKGKQFRGERRNETDRGRENDSDRGETILPSLYSIHKATVQSVRPFGLFVRMDGFRNHGLVHLSQVSDHEVTKRDDTDAVKIEALSSVAAEGESVWVKVISVKTEEDGSVKVGCSLKYVSQGDGKDLDPNNLLLEKLQAKPAWQAPQKMQLEAVYNVTCTRCGGHGHLRKECYSTGDKTYELLKDGDDHHTNGGSLPDRGIVGTLSSAGQSSKAPSGPVGRGRAMVQPAWMKHGVGVVGNVDEGVGRKSSAGLIDVYKDEPALPEKVTTVQEALAVIAKLKEEKHRKREEKRERRSLRRSKKHSSKEGRRDKHRKRHSSDDEYKSKKKHRV